MAIAGFNSLVTCATGASATYASMNGIKDLSISDSRDLLDITDFADGNVHARLAALRDISVSLSGDFEPADTGYLNLRSSYTTGVPLALQLFSSAVATTSGFAYLMLVESIDVSGAVDGKLEVSVSLSIDASSGTAIFAL